MIPKKTKKPKNKVLKSSLESLVIDDISKYSRAFREPIYGDIFVNELENVLIDSYEFQKLQYIKQLGPAYLVFSGAVHTRFLHSLGVLYITDSIIRNISASSDKINISDNKYWAMVTRAAALLHDLPSIAFSHTLDDEGNLFPKQWKNEFRVRKLFGENSEIRGNTKNLLYNRFKSALTKLKEIDRTNIRLANIKTLSEFAQGKEESVEEKLKNWSNSLLVDVLSDVARINCTDETVLKAALGRLKGKLTTRELRVSRDIIGNTVCADLLDYIRRDFFFTGIDKNYDDRLLRYATVNGKWNFAYIIYDRKTRQLKPSVISQLLDALDLRYKLTETINCHKTEVMFAAMITEAVNFTLQEKFNGNPQELEEEIIDFGDENLLKYLEENGVEATKKIIKRIRRREKYAVVKEYGNIQGQTINGEIIRYEKIATHIRNALRIPHTRYDLEHRIVNWLSPATNSGGESKLNYGDIIIHCPRSSEEVFKELYTKVQYKPGKTVILKEFSMKDFRLTGESTYSDVYLFNRIHKKRDELIEAYRNLWKARIFLYSECLNWMNQIATLIDYILNKFHAYQEIYAPPFLPPKAQDYLNEIKAHTLRIDKEIGIPTLEEMLG